MYSFPCPYCHQELSDTEEPSLLLNCPSCNILFAFDLTNKRPFRTVFVMSGMSGSVSLDYSVNQTIISIPKYNIYAGESPKGFRLTLNQIYNINPDNVYDFVARMVRLKAFL